MVNPVLVNDLRKNLFRRKPVLAFAYMAGAILALTLSVPAVVPSGAFVNRNAPPFWFIPDLIVPILAPAFAAGAFAKEHEQRTWQDVLLTRLTTWQILSGKFLACLLPTLLAVVVLLPPFALAMILMNVDWALNPSPWPLVMTLELTVSAIFYLSLSLLCSYHCNNTRTALAVSYVLLAVYAVCNFLLWKFLLTPTVNEMRSFSNYQSYGNQPWDRSEVFALLSPMEIMHLIQSCALTVGFLTLLALRIRRRRA